MIIFMAKKSENTKKLDFIFLICTVILISLSWFFFKFVVAISYIPSESMESTLITKDFTLSNRLAYENTDVKKGDIVIFNYTESDEETNEEYIELVVKRVIGTAGDLVEIKEGSVYVNNVLLDEPYVDEEAFYNTDGDGLYEVPDGCVFVMGDNRDSSYDGRYWAEHYLSEDDIVAKTFFAVGFNDGFHINFFN